MANTKNIYTATFIASASMLSSQYCFVKVTSGTQMCGVCDTSGEQMLGILQNNPRAGYEAAVMLVGMSKLRGAGTVSVNGLITTDNVGEGLAPTLTSGEYVMCMANEAVADGKTSEVLLRGTPFRAQ